MLSGNRERAGGFAHDIPQLEEPLVSSLRDAETVVEATGEAMASTQTC
jgi:hypothetical protein